MQDQFLKAIAEAHAPVTIYLVNGIRLVGHIESYDQYGLTLGGNSQQFVYKHAISTIVPSGDFSARMPPPEIAAAVPTPLPEVAAPPAEIAAAAPPDEIGAEPKKPKTTLRPRIKRTITPPPK